MNIYLKKFYGCRVVYELAINLKRDISSTSPFAQTDHQFLSIAQRECIETENDLGRALTLDVGNAITTMDRENRSLLDCSSFYLLFILDGKGERLNAKGNIRVVNDRKAGK